MRLKTLKDVFAIGDIAYMTTPKYVNGHPQLAAVANEQAKVLAKKFQASDKKQAFKRIRISRQRFDGYDWKEKSGG